MTNTKRRVKFYKNYFIFINLPMLIVLLQCRTYYFIDSNAGTHKLEDKLDEKIALVGFPTYEKQLSVFQFLPQRFNSVYLKYVYTKEEYRIKKPWSLGSTADSDSFVYIVKESNSLKKNFKFGKDIADVSIISEASLDLTQEEIKQFIDQYLKQVSLLGLDEMSKLFDYDSKEKKFIFKNREVDYYLLCVPGPPYKRYTHWGRFFEKTTFLFSFISLGLFPLLTIEESESKFYLYDRNLNLLDTHITNHNFWTISSWWITSHDSSKIEKFDDLSPTSPLIFKWNIDEYSKKFPSIINSIKSKKSDSKIREDKVDKFK